jgi:hypothetical protein
MELKQQRNEIQAVIEVVSRLELSGKLPTKEVVLPELTQALRVPFSDAARILVRAAEAGYITRVGPPACARTT